MVAILTQMCLCIVACVAIQSATAKSLDNAQLVGNIVNDGDSQQNFQHQQQAHHNRQHKRRQQRDSSGSDLAGSAVHEKCESVRRFFDTIDIKLNDKFDEKGAICNGNCCANNTEAELHKKASNEFERLLHHHTKSLRGILESTANLFQDHVLELAKQSENKTLNVFSQVYRRMVPLSRKLIHNLYAEIIRHLKRDQLSSSNNGLNNLNTLEEAIHKFFVHLFPVAYHQAVHLNKDNYGELHEDYISCLQHTYDDLQPFGTIPKEIKHNLLQSVQTATIFMNSLQQSAEVLSTTDELYASYMTSTCQKHLVKMSYCPSCNGLEKTGWKLCYSYCMNVLRGCSAQYAGVLDAPWSGVVDAFDNLVTTHIRSDSGIVTTIKQLDGKLSETIMRAMENGPELEKKVKKTCGTPKLLPSLAADNEIRATPQHQIKWATPPDAEILRFLSTIDKSKEFYSNIVNNICEDENVQANDHNCWTGDRIGDYTQLVMSTGIDTQRYNPEVPLGAEFHSSKLNELEDKLLKIRKTIGNAIPSASRSYSDIQSDMARHDEEGSGRMTDDVDDEEYGNMHGSGDGSGDGPTSTPDDPMIPTVVANNDIESRSRAAPTTAPLCLASAITTTLVTITFYMLSSS